MMESNQNTVIVLLTVTAAILAAVLVGSYTDTAEQAWADAPATGGDYTVTTGAWDATIDLVYVINIAGKQLNAYVINPKNKALEVVDKVDLKKTFRSR